VKRTERSVGGTLFLLWVSIIAGCGRGEGQPPPLPDPEVKVAKPVFKQVTDYENFPGQLEAVNAVELRARVSGYLEKVNFKEGEEVKKGEVLFEIDSRSYEADLAKAEGSVVQSAGLLKRLDSDFDREALLLRKSVVGREEYDKVVGDRVEAKGQHDVALANREMARLNLSWTKVRSPLTGRVSRRYIDPGNLVKADDTILTSIVSLDPIYAYFDLDESTMLGLRRLIQSGKVKWSLNESLPVELGLADEQGFPLKGKINFADNRVDSGTGTWRLRAVVRNPDGTLAPGLFVRVHLPIGNPFTPLLVCEQALGTDQGQKFVYVVETNKADKDGITKPVDEVVYRRVKVGRLHGGLRVIEEGLKADDRVIVSGLQRVHPGSAVKAVELDHMPLIAGADAGH
jgi:membrane fusion protein, multidrug efflux system